MRLAFFDTPRERAIVEELLAWSEQVLEVPSEHFNGLPPCPYAKTAWAEGRVSILFKYEHNYQCLWSTLSQFDDAFDLVVIVDLVEDRDPEVFHEYLDGVNEAIAKGVFIDKDVWVMGFHPGDDPNDFVADADFEAITDDVYALIFVQRLSKLHVAADKLKKKGYYAAYDDLYDTDSIYARREQLYRRLKNGDETS
jgi:hypothetical protein